jgi:glycosyltransferase involved in cell wall biosynthesis
MFQMFCSIIIPIFNRDQILSESLNSIINQKFTNWECILVDDGSSDHSINIANEFSLKDPRFKFYKRPDYLKKGANSCRNYGYKQSLGDCIQWFDSDDIMPPNYLEEKINIFSTESCDIVVSNAKYFELDINISSFNKKFHLNNNISAFDLISGQGWFQTSQALIRRSIIKVHKPFNEKLQRNQETEFFIRLLIQKCKLKFCDNTFVLIRNHNSSITGEYKSLPEGKRLLLDWPAYRLIYLTFKYNQELNLDIKNFFSKYFLRLLLKVNCNFKDYSKIFIFGIRYNIFPLKISTKIFFLRSYSKFKNTFCLNFLY